MMTRRLSPSLRAVSRLFGERAEADRDIGLPAGNIDQPVGKADVDEDVRIEADELAEQAARW